MKYVELAPAHPGKVPVVELLDVMEVKARTTSYMPSFGIIGWISLDEVLQRPTEDEDFAFETAAPAKRSGNDKPPAADKVAVRGDLDDEIPF
jgi:hypothetical protein